MGSSLLSHPNFSAQLREETKRYAGTGKGVCGVEYSLETLLRSLLRILARAPTPSVIDNYDKYGNTWTQTLWMLFI